MSNQEKRIAEYLTAPNILVNTENVAFLFSNLRQVLEIEQGATRFPRLMFFCNWLLHPKLDRKNTTEAILRDFRECIVSHYKVKSDVSVELSKQIGLQKLKVELIDFLKSKSIDSKAIEIPENWNQILNYLLPQLLDKPVEYSGLEKIQNEIRASSKVNVDYNIVGFKFVPFNNKICIELISDELDSLKSRIIIEFLNV